MDLKMAKGLAYAAAGVLMGAAEHARFVCLSLIQNENDQCIPLIVTTLMPVLELSSIDHTCNLPNVTMPMRDPLIPVHSAPGIKVGIRMPEFDSSVVPAHSHTQTANDRSAEDQHEYGARWRGGSLFRSLFSHCFHDLRPCT
jgi:hypothetical protein